MSTSGLDTRKNPKRAAREDVKRERERDMGDGEATPLQPYSKPYKDPLSVLPNELIEIIFDFLCHEANGKEAPYSAKLVNRAWYRAIKSNYVYNNTFSISDQDIGPCSSEESLISSLRSRLSRHLSRCGNIRNIQISILKYKRIFLRSFFYCLLEIARSHETSTHPFNAIEIDYYGGPFNSEKKGFIMTLTESLFGITAKTLRIRNYSKLIGQNEAEVFHLATFESDLELYNWRLRGDADSVICALPSNLYMEGEEREYEEEDEDKGKAQDAVITRSSSERRQNDKVQDAVDTRSSSERKQNDKVQDAVITRPSSERKHKDQDKQAKKAAQKRSSITFSYLVECTNLKNIVMKNSSFIMDPATRKHFRDNRHRVNQLYMDKLRTATFDNVGNLSWFLGMVKSEELQRISIHGCTFGFPLLYSTKLLDNVSELTITDCEYEPTNNFNNRPQPLDPNEPIEDFSHFPRYDLHESFKYHPSTLLAEELLRKLPKLERLTVKHSKSFSDPILAVIDKFTISTVVIE
ncbi:hypothetical protein E3P99_01916 [Wallemia hederae]|uniref:F-box domain-containing protein n=1 Tax=Wallemia hederae TaxID=1540922 RepID=A0A4T0FN28_9BASI|nr:hypothetical protein E3P99_01916 [Wallemia hederae]